MKRFQLNTAAIPMQSRSTYLVPASAEGSNLLMGKV
jgi:hypothetical protein